jgi:3-(3-hydroxy-phenyl)propionate hydroxylase/6-hydroxy-3-succinoylpyridine 3-monooxygenase
MTMMKKEEIREGVIVVGAGPTGALTALGLAQRGVEVLLLEAEDEVVASPRAMVYHWAVLEGLDRLGVLPDIESRGFTTQDFMLRVFETGEDARMSHSVLEPITAYPYNVHLGQHRVVEVALEHLGRLPNAEVRFGTRVESVESIGDRAAVEIEGPGGPARISAPWVLAADGGRSAVRSSLALSFDGITWDHRFVATNIYFPFDEAGDFFVASMLLDPENGAIVARIDNEGMWRWTWGESADLPVESVADRLPARFAALGMGDSGYEVAGFTPYRMHQRAVPNMRSERVLLLGDAAHVTNPTGGLGLTSGLFDLFALIEPLRGVIDGEVGTEVLDEWSRERLDKFLQVASPMASQFNRDVYLERDLEKRRAVIAGAKEAIADPEMNRGRLLAFKGLETGLPEAVGRPVGGA